MIDESQDQLKGIEEKSRTAEQDCEPRVLAETEDGFQVSVPLSKLDDWEEAQKHPHELNKAEKEVLRRIMERMYGKSDDQK